MSRCFDRRLWCWLWRRLERHYAFCVRCFEQFGLCSNRRCFDRCRLNFNLWSRLRYRSIVCHRGFNGRCFDSRLGNGLCFFGNRCFGGWRFSY